MLVLKPALQCRDSNAGQGQPLLVSGVGPPSRSYKVICSLFPLELGLWPLSCSYFPSQYWLLLMPGLGPPDGSYDAN